MLGGALRTERTEGELQLSCSDKGNEGLKQRLEETAPSPKRTATSWGITSNGKPSKAKQGRGNGASQDGGMGKKKKKMDTVSHGHPQAKPMPMSPDANWEGQSKHPHYRSGSRAKNNTQIQPCLLPDRGLQHLDLGSPLCSFSRAAPPPSPAPPPPGGGREPREAACGWPTNTSRCPVPPSRELRNCVPGELQTGQEFSIDRHLLLFSALSSCRSRASNRCIFASSPIVAPNEPTAADRDGRRFLQKRQGCQHVCYVATPQSAGPKVPQPRELPMLLHQRATKAGSL